MYTSMGVSQEYNVRSVGQGRLTPTSSARQV